MKEEITEFVKSYKEKLQQKQAEEVKRRAEQEEQKRQKEVSSAQRKEAVTSSIAKSLVGFMDGFLQTDPFAMPRFAETTRHSNLMSAGNASGRQKYMLQ